MILVRHNRLSPPFDDYAQLTAKMLDELAGSAIAPDIAPLPERIPWDDDAFQKLRTADFFLCSGSGRTQQTCRALMERFCPRKKVSIDEDLNEISFVPSKLMDCPSENPLEAVRKRLYPRLAERGAGVEDLDVLRYRINCLIERYESKRCILFSHGFLIRLVASYYRQRDMGRALSGIDDIKPVDFLGWVSVAVKL